MLPSLIAEELRGALSGYLSTTFALADDDVRERLETFLTDPADGIFRGPFVRLKLPFQQAEDGWAEALDWSPSGFEPYRHQAEAFARLSSKRGRPDPTLVTTGTGSGKTESFLIPILDHCRREKGAGRTGIKALVLYPMNALANDQGRRIAAMLDEHAEALSEVSVGLYTGDSTAGSESGFGRLLQQRRELRDNPPDILLTNYKMLDFLLLRPEDAGLWSQSHESMQYVVLDEFHTYDGAQGTDVAMLLRRLGMALGVSEPGRPLGRVTPVATSATLGEGQDAGGKLLEFAGRVFGEPFGINAVIGEQRLNAEDWLRGVDQVDGYEYDALPMLEQLPEPLEGQRQLDRLAQVARVFFRDPVTNSEVNPEGLNNDPSIVSDTDRLGRRLMRHPLTAALLATAASPRSLRDLVRDVAPVWATARNDAGERAVGEFLGLLSLACAGSGERPLLQVEIQLWIREVSRVDRVVAAVPEFRWGLDGPRTDVDQRYLPAIYCRHCGRSGWGSARRSRELELETRTQIIRQQSVRKTGRFRAMIHAPGEEQADDLAPLSWLDPVTLELMAQRPGAERECLPVLVTPDDDASTKDRCPSCGLDEGIRFLGSRVATLISVSLGHLFGSADVEREQKKTLVFTDSVQDAAHRAGFIEARSYALNFRSLIRRATGQDRITLAELDGALLATAKTPEDRFSLLPPDLAENKKGFREFWAERRCRPSVRARVKKRIEFAGALEFGLNARTGRTLELTGTITAHVDAGAPERLTRVALEVLAEHREDRPQFDLGVADANPLAWIRGVLERMRLQGGINHQWLTTYLREDGNRWSIWGGRPAEMPAFPTGRPAPAFPTTAARSEAFDSVVAKGTWYCGWTARTLRIAESEAPHLVRRLFEHLHAEGIVSAAATKTGATVYYLEPDSIVLDPVDVGQPNNDCVVLRCDVCSLRFPGTPDIAGQLTDGPCMRNKCPGSLRPTRLGADYYRELYSSGRVRRISAHEHTSLLDAATRVSLEAEFKSSTAADAPNVLTCTPTLELGIDIGDLSAVGLTSLPRSVAGYVQRVGRAGRQTGSALVFAVLPGRGIELHWLSEPLDMIAGEVTPPACYLDAAEIIRRQYLASLIDRAARSGGVKPPRTAGRMLTTGLAEGSWLRDLMRDARANAANYVADFLSGFHGHITGTTEATLAEWAGVGLAGDLVSPMEREVEHAVRGWIEEMAELRVRAAALEEEVTRLLKQANLLDDAGKRDLNRVRGEYRAATGQRSAMSRQYWITAFEGLGLLPNYTLLDDRTRLDVGLTWTDERTGQSTVERTTYERGSQVALYELAPGSTFYVSGAAINIDAVDLGTERNPNLLRWRFCPSCGWSARDNGPTSCPRCHDNRAADTGQVLQTVRFRKVSAFASRDGARFGDDDEDRKRTRFTIAHAVDVPQSEITRAWGLSDYPFGAEFARIADIRWVNLGRADAGGPERILGGHAVQAPLFQACKHCGVVPAAQPRVRDLTDARHRGWCPQRRVTDPDGWVSVGLLHELRTQAVRLLVPPIVIADDTLLQSIRAALLLGLRKVLGGEPDHLDVLVTPDPDRRGERYLLVLHDTVPGGTGYLAQFADPEAVRQLLAAAAKTLEECICAQQPVAACHRCLLPYVPPSAVPDVRRDRALELLHDILARWQPQDLRSLREITVSPHETPIELRLRALLTSWAKKNKGEPRVSPGAGGDQLTFRLDLAGDSSRTWTMVAQPKLGFVQPDFLLRTEDGSVSDIAVFCDGRRFHATAEHNRLADDADKRAGLRAQGYVVWAITHDDLDAFEQALNDAPATGYPYLTGVQRDALARLAKSPKLFGPRRATAGELQGDAMTLLTRYLCRPHEDAWAAPAMALSLALTGGDNKAGGIRVDPPSVPLALAAFLRGEPIHDAEAGERLLVRQSAGGAGLLIDVTFPSAVRVYLGVDDRNETIAAPAHERSWRDWLALSNLLQFLGTVQFTAGTTSLPVPGGESSRTVQPRPASVEVDTAWAPFIGMFGDAADALISDLVDRHVRVGELGFEAFEGEVVIDLAWPERRIAVFFDGHEGDDGPGNALRADGWTVLPPDPGVISSAVGPEKG
ncbi:MAG TPA: DEAD/DEAH box helicase [Pseudonocardiaceae bacterium]|nr:DEAD/DEAH box helicase [Pseudonocardiaceae bacterium]